VLANVAQRFGLKTVSGQKITAKGVKPIGKVQWQFKTTYLYGIVEPQTGASFFYEFSHLNTDCFQIFLNLVAQQFPDDLLMVRLVRSEDYRGYIASKRRFFCGIRVQLLTTRTGIPIEFAF
jgi:hypothetical protein